MNEIISELVRKMFKALNSDNNPGIIIKTQ